MASFKFRSGESRSTVVFVPASNHYLEVRSGDITWTAAFCKAHPDVKQRTWATVEEWQSSVAAEKYESIPVILKRLIDLQVAADNSPWKLSRFEDLVSYMLTSRVRAFIHTDGKKMFRDAIISKIKQLLPYKCISASLREKMESLLHECMTPAIGTKEKGPVLKKGTILGVGNISVEVPVAIMSVQEYNAAVCAMAGYIKHEYVRKDDVLGKELLSFYKEEFLAFLGREDVIAFLKTDSTKRIDMRAFVRWLITKDDSTSASSIAAGKLLMRIPA